MSGRELTIQAVGGMFGFNLPPTGKRAKCPIRKHKNPGLHFGIFEMDGRSLFKCHACSEPGNIGDAVALYAKLANVDRKQAWKTLKDEGYAVPGHDDPRFARDANGERSQEPRRREAPPLRVGPPPVDGVKPKTVLPMNQKTWAEWHKLRTGALAKYAADRGLTEEVCRKLDMIDVVGGDVVGFTYHDPETGKPCRVKIRTIGKEKRFWCEPRPAEGQQGAKALAPLYLAHLLKPSASNEVVIVEGEIDAVSLTSVGFPNVVSLPDGSSSAKTVDLQPLFDRFKTWLLATDGDGPGEQAAAELSRRALKCGADPVRVLWGRTEGTNGDVQAYKDANDALKAGFDRDDFLACLEAALAKKR